MITPEQDPYVATTRKLRHEATNMQLIRLLTTLAVFACHLSGRDSHAAERDTAAAPVDFAREILPLLSEKCFVCHGPDAKDKDALRLDAFATATSDRGGYRAINPDAPAESELLVRIQSAENPMPPEESEKKLTAQDRELLKRWVLQGGGSCHLRNWPLLGTNRLRRLPRSTITWWHN